MYVSGSSPCDSNSEVSSSVLCSDCSRSCSTSAASSACSSWVLVCNSCASPASDTCSWRMSVASWMRPWLSSESLAAYDCIRRSSSREHSAVRLPVQGAGQSGQGFPHLTEFDLGLLQLVQCADQLLLSLFQVFLALDVLFGGFFQGLRRGLGVLPEFFQACLRVLRQGDDEQCGGQGQDEDLCCVDPTTVHHREGDLFPVPRNAGRAPRRLGSERHECSSGCFFLRTSTRDRKASYYMSVCGNASSNGLAELPREKFCPHRIPPFTGR